MPGLKRDADFAIGFEAADSRTVAGARIDHDERPPRRIDFGSGGRHDAHQRVIHRPIEFPTVDQKLSLIVEYMRCSLGEMLAILIATLAHNIPEQHTALCRIDEILKSGAEHVEWPGIGFDRL
jgi:hypothetical protein